MAIGPVRLRSPTNENNPSAGSSSFRQEVSDHLCPVLRLIPSFIPGRSVSVG
ncbi:hypothetical protein HanRHA438_Chr09g0388201 [Helianthus annuus]|nr:hypothetical protein HanRHA438_Chr09g0388201 [Helianthus annuus]